MQPTTLGHHGLDEQIIEHLKVRNDDVDGPQEPDYPRSATCTPLQRGDVKNRYVR